MSLEVMLVILAPSRPVPVQLTGTRTIQARKAIGTKILSLHNKKQKTSFITILCFAEVAYIHTMLHTLTSKSASKQQSPIQHGQ